MKVLIWSPTGVGTHYSGPATSTYRLMSFIKSSHPDCTFHLIHGSTEQKQDKVLFESEIKIQTVHSNGMPMHGWFNKARFIWKSIRYVTSSRPNYDLVYIPMINVLTIPPIVLFKLMKVPTVTRLATNHDLYNKGFLRNFFRFAQLKVFFLKKSNLIISISSEIYNRLLEFGVPSKKILKLPNSVDVSIYSSVDCWRKSEYKKKFGINDSSFVVSLVGSICNRKNQESLIMALRELPNDITILLAGPFINDQYKNYFLQLISELDLTSRVKLIGHISDVSSVYNASNVYCLPSEAEGMPNSLLEAMSCGLPCIASDIAGNRDLIGKSEVRGLYTDGTPESIAKSIKRLYGDSELRDQLSSSARKFILDKHDYRKNAPILYSRLLQVGRPRRTTKKLGSRGE